MGRKATTACAVSCPHTTCTVICPHPAWHVLRACCSTLLRTAIAASALMCVSDIFSAAAAAGGTADGAWVKAAWRNAPMSFQAPADEGGHNVCLALIAARARAELPPPDCTPIVSALQAQQRRCSGSAPTPVVCGGTQKSILPGSEHGTHAHHGVCHSSWVDCAAVSVAAIATGRQGGRLTWLPASGRVDSIDRRWWHACADGAE